MTRSETRNGAFGTGLVVVEDLEVVLELSVVLEGTLIDAALASPLEEP